MKLEVEHMTQIPGTPLETEVQQGLERLESLFCSKAKVNEDLSLCFTCLKWTTGDEGCRRQYRCELELQQDQLDGKAAG